MLLMGRRLLIRSTSLPYHLYGRSNNKEWFYLPKQEVWEILVKLIGETTISLGLRVHAFVLMSNHYHLLATTSDPENSVDRVMCRLLKKASDQINHRANRINHVFGGPYKWSLIRTPHHYEHVLRYVYQNPVRSKICRFVEEYPFSTLSYEGKGENILQVSRHIFESDLHHKLNQKSINFLDWLNEEYDEEHVEAMRRALYRREFKFLPHRLTKKLPHQFRSLEISA